MSAAKVRNSEIMFHTRTTKRGDGSTRICNRFAFRRRPAATSDKKFAPAVLRAAKLSKRRKSFRNKTFIFSCQTHGFFSEAFGFSFRFQISGFNLKFKARKLKLQNGYTFDLDSRVARQTRRLHGRPRRFVVTEKLGVNFVHRRKVVHIR